MVVVLRESPGGDSLSFAAQLHGPVCMGMLACYFSMVPKGGVRARALETVSGIELDRPS